MAQVHSIWFHKILCSRLRDGTRRLGVILITAGLPDRLLDGAVLLVMRGLIPGSAVEPLIRFLAEDIMN